jgi:antitoxin HigA-1
MAMRNPPHPGQFIRDEIIEANDLTVTAAANLLEVGRSALSNLLNGHADLSPEMALRIELAFGIRMDTMMAMQTAYDVAKMRRQASKIHVRAFVPAAAA